MPKIYRQGDCMLLEVKALPEGAARQKVRGKKLTLLLGEATGHHHRFEFVNTDHNVKLFHAGAARYVEVVKPARLLHEEHSTVDVPPGVYQIPVQVEWSDENEPIQVQD